MQTSLTCEIKIANFIGRHMLAAGLVPSLARASADNSVVVKTSFNRCGNICSGSLQLPGNIMLNWTGVVIDGEIGCGSYDLVDIHQRQIAYGMMQANINQHNPRAITTRDHVSDYNLRWNSHDVTGRATRT